ncbi:MAG: glycerate kinase [Myxococcaceae bacterium]|nr:glycerate kinase [Myxococcaceae bacterium]
MSPKVLIAPQEFKGTLTAAQAAQAIMRGFRSVHETAELNVVPIADGGAGTVDVLLAAGEGQERFTFVTDPIGRPVKARWGLIDAGKTAVIEMAAASGLSLLQQSERDPMKTHTYGTGELIRAALDAGATRILVGAGGSATCDGGVGAASALGVAFLDDKGGHLPLGPRHLGRLAKIDCSALDPRLAKVQLEVLTDVRNPLLGEEGSARIYGPQKGADLDDVERLDDLLEQLARVTREATGQAHEQEAGAGAAGGLGFGLRAFCHAQLRRGFDVISEALGLFAKVNECDLVITGEGQLDLQSAYFKGPYALGRLAHMQKKRVVLFAGAVLGGSSGVRDAFDEVVVVGKGAQVEPERAAQQLEDAVTRWALRQSR